MADDDGIDYDYLETLDALVDALAKPQHPEEEGDGAAAAGPSAAGRATTPQPAPSTDPSPAGLPAQLAPPQPGTQSAPAWRPMQAPQPYQAPGSLAQQLGMGQQQQPYQSNQPQHLQHQHHHHQQPQQQHQYQQQPYQQKQQRPLWPQNGWQRPPVQPSQQQHQQPPAGTPWQPVASDPNSRIQQLQQELMRAQQEAQAQSRANAQLHSKVQQLEQEQSRRHDTGSGGSSAASQITMQEMQRQAAVLQQRLMFAEQEVQEGQRMRSSRDENLKRAEALVSELQAELRKKEEAAMQLAAELQLIQSQRRAAAAEGGGAGASQVQLPRHDASGGGAMDLDGVAPAGEAAPAGAGPSAAGAQSLSLSEGPASQLAGRGFSGQQQLQQRQVGSLQPGSSTAAAAAANLAPDPAAQESAGQPSHHAAAAPHLAPARGSATGAALPAPVWRASGAAAGSGAAAPSAGPSLQAGAVEVAPLLPPLATFGLEGGTSSAGGLWAAVWTTCRADVLWLLRAGGASGAGQSDTPGAAGAAGGALADVQQQLQLLAGQAGCGEAVMGAILSLLWQATAAEAGQHLQQRQQQQQQQHHHHHQHQQAAHASSVSQLSHVHLQPVGAPCAAALSSCLHLLRVLLLHDGRCLQLAAWQLGCTSSPGGGAPVPGGAAAAAERSGAAAAAAALDVLSSQPLWAEWAAQPAALGPSSSSGARHPGGGSRAEAWPGSPVAGSSGSAGAAGAALSGGLLAPLLALASDHKQDAAVVEAVAGVWVALAGRLPAPRTRQVLAPLLMSGAAAQLLRSPSRATKARGVELLQEMLRCPGIATAINTAAQGLLGAAPSQQQQPQQHSGPAGSGARSHPLQPSNRAAAGSILTSLAKASSQQAAAKAAAAAAAGAHTHSSGSQMAPGVWESLSAGLLDCLSCPIEDAGPAPSSRGSSSGGARSTFVSSAAGTGASLAWGRYELHRRALALVAGLLQSGQVAAVLGLLHEELSSGEGLAQRLLAIADAAATASGRDPQALAGPGTLAASSCGGGTGGGAEGAWHGWQERVRLAQEAMAALKALLSSPGAIGKAAAADLLSSRHSVRCALSAASKLMEWPSFATAAQLPTSSGGSSGGASGRGSCGGGASGGERGLELAPWAAAAVWQGIRGSAGAGAAAAAAPGAQLALPVAQVGEVAALAASIKRRLTYYLQHTVAAG